METTPNTVLQTKAKMALWLLALACLSAAVEYGAMLLAPLFSNITVVGPGVIVIPIVGLAGAFTCAYIAMTGRIPAWIWKSQREEFERLFARPNKFLLIAIFVSVVLCGISTAMMVAILTGNF